MSSEAVSTRLLFAKRYLQVPVSIRMDGLSVQNSRNGPGWPTRAMRNGSSRKRASRLLGEPFFTTLAGVSTIGFFSKDKALDIRIFVPPSELGERFAAVVLKMERLRAQQREVDRQAEPLFQTLLHRTFADA